MTTEGILEIIAEAKTRVDVVPALATTLPPDGSVDYKVVRKAIADKWSANTYTWILTQAWKIAEQAVSA